jgi:hypothetical protein
MYIIIFHPTIEMQHVTPDPQLPFSFPVENLTGTTATIAEESQSTRMATESHSTRQSRWTETGP